MATTSSRRQKAPVLPLKNAFARSISPGRFYSSTSDSSISSSSGFASSTSSFSSSFSTAASSLFQRPSSPTRVNLYGSSPFTPSVRFSIDRSISPSRSITVSSRDQVVKKQSTKKTCMCSPTSHPGSFRCSLHKNTSNNSRHSSSGLLSSNRLNARRSAMTNSLVRIGTVEGDLVKRALAALIRPSSHQQRRRAAFEPRPSRLSRMSRASDGDNL
ncbi:hypothetical protein RJ641_022152 [Dillenia turbinata]|uniref:Serine-rich protein-like protein n=1 Tax=Dillenia turbinata TaxID=194707 RepID=A0AAN8UJZ1_9MAGN